MNFEIYAIFYLNSFFKMERDNYTNQENESQMEMDGQMEEARLG